MWLWDNPVQSLKQKYKSWSQRRRSSRPRSLRVTRKADCRWPPASRMAEEWGKQSFAARRYHEDTTRGSAFVYTNSNHTRGTALHFITAMKPKEKAEHALPPRHCWMCGDGVPKFALFSLLRSLRGSQLPHRSTMGLQSRHALYVFCGGLFCLHKRAGVGGHRKVQETPSPSKLDLGQSCRCWSWRDSFCQHY